MLGPPESPVALGTRSYLPEGLGSGATHQWAGTGPLDPGIITSHLTEHCPPEDNTRSTRPRPHSQRPWDPAAPISGPTLVMSLTTPTKEWALVSGPLWPHSQPCQDSAHPPAGCSQPQDLLSPNPTHRNQRQSWDNCGPRARNIKTQHPTRRLATILGLHGLPSPASRLTLVLRYLRIPR